jgi:hypothetical protein
MHLLYADESGSVTDPNQAFFILAGLSVFERSGHWIEQELNTIARRFSPIDPYMLEFHGSPMRSGFEGWERHSFSDRIQAMHDALDTCVCQRSPRDVRLFAAVVRKAAVAGQDPAEIAFEQLCSRFDHYLARRYHANPNDPQRGMIIFDKTSERTEKRIQTLARDFKYEGHTWGRTRNYAEAPVFMDSRASRLIQLADLVAYAIFRKFERGDETLFSKIENCFDTEGGVQHGMYIRR